MTQSHTSNSLNVATFPLAKLEIGMRAFNALNRRGFVTVGDLLDFHRQWGVMSIPRFGKRSEDELAFALRKIGVDL